MPFFLCIQSYLLSSKNVVNEAQFDETGEVTVQSRKTKLRHITIKNNYAEPISIYPYKKKKSRKKLFEIPAKSSKVIETSDWSRFYAKRNSTISTAPPQFKVLPSIDKYSFGAKRQKNRKKHSAVKISNGIELPVKVAIRNLGRKPMNVLFKSSDGLVLLNTQPILAGRENTLSHKVGNEFWFVSADNMQDVWLKHTLRKIDSFLAIEDPNDPAPELIRKKIDQRLEFMEDYLNKTGIPWRQYYQSEPIYGSKIGPRDPLRHFQWPAKKVGDSFTVHSEHGHWSCRGLAEGCQSTDPLTFKLEVISKRPKAFVIHNFLNDFEVDELKALANPLLEESKVGMSASEKSKASNIRTSRNAWLPRAYSRFTDSLYKRVADLVQVDERKLVPTDSAENLQVLHYQVGQKYGLHYDWSEMYPETRFLTLLLYLSDQQDKFAGGETSFPKGEDGKGFVVHPGKGSAVLFYSLLEDGNGDDLAIHEALPVLSGEKWLANFWVWDPHIHFE